MSFTDLVGSLGVFILLLAYFLTLFHFLHEDSKIYIALNIIGAGIACYASCLLHYKPFIILEASWVIVSCFALVKNFFKKNIQNE
jgi:hypothetical protein